MTRAGVFIAFTDVANPAGAPLAFTAILIAIWETLLPVSEHSHAGSAAVSLNPRRFRSLSVVPHSWADSLSQMLNFDVATPDHLSKDAIDHSDYATTADEAGKAATGRMRH